MTLRERFDSKWMPEPNSGCWLWLGTTTGCYGGMTIGSRRDGTRRFIGAHRVSFELHIGPIPAGLSVLHKCDTPFCVNPDHVYLGTHDDNMADMKLRGRSPHGERHGQAKLTLESVREIRLRVGGESHSQVARRFGVSRSLVSMIVSGKRWVGI